MSLEPVDPLCVSLVHQYLVSTKSDLVDEFKSKYQPKKINLTLEEVVSKWKEEQLARGLVFQHLKRVTPALVQEFVQSYHISSTDDAKEVIEVIEQQQLMGSLILRHLKQVTPALAPEFRGSQGLRPNVPDDIIPLIESAEQVIHQVEDKQNQSVSAGSAQKENPDRVNKRERRGMKTNTFTTEEESRVERAMANGEDLAVLAKQLGRSYGSIYHKTHSLKKAAAASKRGKYSSEEIHRIQQALVDNEDYREVAKELGRISSHVRVKMLRMKCKPNLGKKSKFSIEEDFLILDKVVPRMKVNNLSSTGFFSHKALMELATVFKRNYDSIKNRWETTLQHWLLQHYTGTSGLRVERMLTSLVAQKYKDHKGVDWSEIVKEHKEFAGHTNTSIRSLFHGCLRLAKLRKNKGDVSLQDVAEYAADVRKEKKEPLSTTIRREKVIEYFKRKAEDLGIEVKV